MCPPAKVLWDPVEVAAVESTDLGQVGSSGQGDLQPIKECHVMVVSCFIP